MRSRILSSVLAVAMATTLGAALTAQGGPPGGGAAQGGGGGRGGGRGGFGLAPLLMETDAFPDGGIVPAKYVSAGGGASVLPGFKISGAPMTAVSYAVIFHDIDVSLKNTSDDVLHWIAWNIPVSANGWPEGSLPAGSVQGNNLRGQANYMGPGAPAGPRYHHYVFELYALNANLDIPQTASRADLIKAMEGKIVAKSAYVGRFRSEPAAK
jgi:Raf kinase inhibitor-like YbhB/YbcL family protein